jgi:hypothetical protein
MNWHWTSSAVKTGVIATGFAPARDFETGHFRMFAGGVGIEISFHTA